MAYTLFHPENRTALPLSLSAEEFVREFPREGDTVEFKSGTGGDQIRASAVAFSNAEGGVILVGVDDRGGVVGRAADAGARDALHTALASARDLGRYEIHSLDVDGSSITVLSVARREQGFAQTADGRVLVRRGTQDQPAFGAELQRLINARSSQRFEATIVDRAPLDTVSGQLLDRIAKAHGWVVPTHSRERLVEAGLVGGDHLTVAGALYLVTDPGSVLGKAHVEILRYARDDGVDYDRRDEVRGPLDVQLEDAVRKVTEHLGRELVVLGVRRYELPRIPEVVIRECIANALAHRSYEASGTPVRIELRPSAVRVTSPGGLPEPVTVANIREANAARNLDVIRVLRRLGLAEDAGRGVDVMQDAMQEEMLDPPQFYDRGHAVEVVLPVHSVVTPVERAWLRELESRGNLRPADRLVLVHAARARDDVTNRRIREALHVDRQAAHASLRRLRDTGLLTQQGQRGGARYRLASDLQPPAGLRLSVDELAAVVEDLTASGPVRNADVRRATGLDRAESLAILDRLVREGRLVRSGERRGTRYSRP